MFSWMDLIVVANNHKLMNVWNPSIWGHHYSSCGHSFFFSWVNPFQICARAKWDLKNNGVSEDSTSVIESLVSERKKKCRRVGEGSGVWTKHEWDVKWKTGSLFFFPFKPQVEALVKLFLAKFCGFYYRTCSPKLYYQMIISRISLILVFHLWESEVIKSVLSVDISFASFRIGKRQGAVAIKIGVLCLKSSSQKFHCSVNNLLGNVHFIFLVVLPFIFHIIELSSQIRSELLLSYF